MRQLAFLIAAAALSGTVPALAEPVVLRVEAKRGEGTQAAVDSWAGRLPNVMTFPLKGGWTGIGIGPMERAEAEAELARLKAAGQVPQDSFIAPVPEGAVPVGAAPAPAGEPAPAAEVSAAADPAGSPAAGASTFVAPNAPAAADGAAGGAPGAAPAPDPAAAELAVAAPQAAPADQHIRLQRFETREAADEALARWRADFPEAALTQQPDGGFAITLGPLAADVAEAWLDAFRAADRVGKPGAVVPAADLGTVLDPGKPIDLPPPGTAEMPPLVEVQSALRWAGHYDGKIDGKDGPATRAAIAAEVLALRAAPDAASAMQALIARRADWRAQMGLTRLDDPQSGLSVTAPMDRLTFDRNDQGLSIYGPKDESGAALILYSAPGGQQEMLDFTGLVTALGWVPAPDRRVEAGHASLKGRNDTHIGQAEARVVDGQVQGLVLIWPVMDAEDQPRVAAEMIESLSGTPPAAPAEPAPAATPQAADPSGAPPGN